MYEEKVRKFKCYHCPDCNLYAGSETKTIHGRRMKPNIKYCTGGQKVIIFRSDDPKVTVPKWCPKRRVPPTLRIPGGSKFGLFCLLFSSGFFFMLSLFLLYVRLAFSFYCQNHISSKLVLAYIILGYAIVPFYHFCTPIIFSSMGILVVNDSDKESCRIEN